MTPTQFETLKDWIERRAYLRRLIDESPRDRPFVQARLAELEEADEHARRVLVTVTDDGVPVPPADV